MARQPLAAHSGPLDPLPARFYRGSVHRVARDLLGCQLVRAIDGEICTGRIVEVEAYGGRRDPSAHSFRGPTDRCRSMFGPVGHAYVYFTYGNHHCINVVAGDRRQACAVLIRAVEPLRGTDGLRRRRLAACRPGRTHARLSSGAYDHELASGPGRLTQAFAIDRTLDGHSFLDATDLWIAAGPRVATVEWTPRVGLGDNPAAGWHWRVVDPRSRSLSRVPATMPRSAAPWPRLAGCLDRGAARGSPP